MSQLRPGLTAALITRDEERCLDRCLASMKGWVDEIVVVDTGSTDRTIEIALEHNAKVFEKPWPGDFDVARNYSLDEVETEWTLWMDADEWFDHSVGQAVRQAIMREDVSAWMLLRRDLWATGPSGTVAPLKESDLSRYSETQMFRLWRTHPELRLVGVIHEHIPLEDVERLYPDQKLMYSNLYFWHDGYTPDPSRGKLERNLPLLRRELELRPGQMYYEIELAGTLNRLGESEGVEQMHAIADRLLALENEDSPPEKISSSHLSTYLAMIEEAELSSPRTERLLRLCRGWFSDAPGVLFMTAQVEIKRGNLKAAYYDLIEIERMADTGQYDKWTVVNPWVLTEGVWTNLGIVAHQLGNTEVARRNYQKLLDHDPFNAVARQNIALL